MIVTQEKTNDAIDAWGRVSKDLLEQHECSDLTDNEAFQIESDFKTIRTELERAQRMREIVKAVAHVGIDFGYGTYELQQDIIDKARELYEKQSLSDAPTGESQKG